MDPEMYEVARLSMGLRYANELKRQLERGEIDYSAPDHRQADGGSSNSGHAGDYLTVKSPFIKRLDESKRKDQ